MQDGFALWSWLIVQPRMTRNYIAESMDFAKEKMEYLVHPTKAYFE
jgi:hypothetical protein